MSLDLHATHTTYIYFVHRKLRTWEPINYLLFGNCFYFILSTIIYLWVPVACYQQPLLFRCESSLPIHSKIITTWGGVVYGHLPDENFNYLFSPRCGWSEVDWRAIVNYIALPTINADELDRKWFRSSPSIAHLSNINPEGLYLKDALCYLRFLRL